MLRVGWGVGGQVNKEQLSIDVAIVSLIKRNGFDREAMKSALDKLELSCMNTFIRKCECGGGGPNGGNAHDYRNVPAGQLVFRTLSRCFLHAHTSATNTWTANIIKFSLLRASDGTLKIIFFIRKTCSSTCILIEEICFSLQCNCSVDQGS